MKLFNVRKRGYFRVIKRQKLPKGELRPGTFYQLDPRSHIHNVVKVHDVNTETRRSPTEAHFVPAMGILSVPGDMAKALDVEVWAEDQEKWVNR